MPTNRLAWLKTKALSLLDPELKITSFCKWRIKIKANGAKVKEARKREMLFMAFNEFLSFVAQLPRFPLLLAAHLFHEFNVLGLTTWWRSSYRRYEVTDERHRNLRRVIGCTHAFKRGFWNVEYTYRSIRKTSVLCRAVEIPIRALDTNTSLFIYRRNYPGKRNRIEK